MSAKQTLVSASLVVALARIAKADPSPDGQASSNAGKTGQFQLGAGYGTDNGFFATAMISQSNLFGTGDLLAMYAQLSARRQLLDVHFADPWLFDRELRLDLNLYDDKRVFPGFIRDAVGTSALLSHRFDD